MQVVCCCFRLFPWRHRGLQISLHFSHFLLLDLHAPPFPRSRPMEKRPKVDAMTQAQQSAGCRIPRIRSSPIPPLKKKHSTPEATRRAHSVRDQPLTTLSASPFSTPQSFPCLRAVASWSNVSCCPAVMPLSHKTILRHSLCHVRCPVRPLRGPWRPRPPLKWEGAAQTRVTKSEQGRLFCFR